MNSRSGVRTSRILCLLVCVGLWAGSASGQQPTRPGSLRLTVRDVTDLTIAGAELSLTDSSGTSRKAVANDGGEAIFEGLAPGTYTVHVSSPGFTELEVKDLRVRAGAATTRGVVLQIAALMEEINVTPPDEDKALLGAFMDELTPEQLAALPEDPDDLAAVLMNLVGEDAEIRVNGFAGGRLPPGTQVADVRVRYDAASGNGNGGARIEVRTRPGSGRWQNNVTMNLRDDSLNARNAFSGQRPSGQTRQYTWTLNGPLVKNRTGVSLSFDRADTFDQLAIRAAMPEGIYSRLVAQPTTRTGFSGEIQHALTKTQELRAEADVRMNKSLNQGLSEFDLPERAYNRTDSSGEVRLSHRSTYKRQSINTVRVQYGWQSSGSKGAGDATTIRVLDAFTSGGAQVFGGRRTRNYEMEDELELTVHKTHQMVIGLSAEGASVRVDESRNANGTFTFASLEMYQAGLPTTFSQRLASPQAGYSTARAGWYVQDNYRVNKSLMLNLTLRQDVQTHIADWQNLAPRAGLNWTLPGRKTTVRASLGAFSQFFEGSTYEQTLWSNGQLQRDIVISSPGYPDPLLGGVPAAGRPPNLVRARSDLELPYTRRASLGVDRTINKYARLRATYTHNVGRHLFRSLDVNAPVDGVRPDPAFRTITELSSTARSLTRSLDVSLALTYQPRRFSANLEYTLGQALNETDGPLTLPQNSLDLSQEWGTSRQDVRHRFQFSMNTDIRAGFRLTMSARAQSAGAYNITTGLDANGDGLTNERPAGVPRNSGRGVATSNLDMGLTWGRSLGKRQDAAPQGTRAGTGSNTANGLFRFEVFARATNVLNIVSLQNFSGVQTSPFFGRPTSAAAARRLIVGTRAFF
jgi:hypothetical protein